MRFLKTPVVIVMTDGLANRYPAPPETGVKYDKSSSRERYRANLQGEVDSAALYRTLSAIEKNPQLAQVYRRLAAVEEAHAEFWKKRLTGIGQALPTLRPGFSDTGTGMAGTPVWARVRAADNPYA